MSSLSRDSVEEEVAEEEPHPLPAGEEVEAVVVAHRLMEGVKEVLAERGRLRGEAPEAHEMWGEGALVVRAMSGEVEEVAH